MRTIILGEDENQLILSIPEASLDGLDPNKKQSVIDALSRFVVTLQRHDSTLDEDLALLTSVEGMQISLPGTQTPLVIREVFGELMITGNPVDLVRYQEQ